MQQPLPTMAVIDSGLGGISVVRALRGRAPELPLIYLADTAGFPYGNRTAEDLNQRAVALVQALQAQHAVTHVVVACNTLSTLCLAHLRAVFPALTFVGTVPAIKVAAGQSTTRRFTLLATPNTAHSRYSQGLIAEFASDCMVDCFGAPNLARMTESALLGQPVSDAQWRDEIAPCFHDDARGKTDQIILGCTHYPLVLAQLEAHAPWPVQWVDSSAAIARHALAHYHGATRGGPSHAYVAGDAHVATYAPVFAREAFAQTAALTLAEDQPPHAVRG